MPKLPRDCSGREAVKVFQQADWHVNRQTASHIIMEKEGVEAILSVPDHKVLDPGTLRALIRYSGLTVEQFIHLR